MEDKRIILTPGRQPQFIGEWTLLELSLMVQQLQQALNQLMAQIPVKTTEKEE